MFIYEKPVPAFLWREYQARARCPLLVCYSLPRDHYNKGTGRDQWPSPSRAYLKDVIKQLLTSVWCFLCRAEPLGERPIPCNDLCSGGQRGTGRSRKYCRPSFASVSSTMTLLYWPSAIYGYITFKIGSNYFLTVGFDSSNLSIALYLIGRFNLRLLIWS